MRWQGRRESQHVEDRRGRPGVRRMGIGGGLGGLVLLVLVSYVTGTNPLELLSTLEDTAPSTTADAGPPADDSMTRFMRVVLADTEDTWTEIFRAQGARYEPPTLVLFRDATESACGVGQSAMGPFYCPGDRKVYLDLSFFAELDTRFGAPGEFAQA